MDIIQESWPGTYLGVIYNIHLVHFAKPKNYASNTHLLHLKSFREENKHSCCVCLSLFNLGVWEVYTYMSIARVLQSLALSMLRQ